VTLSEQKAIDTGFDPAMATLYASVPGARELAAKASGIVVFPRVRGGGLVVGAD
jgi:hypothetical protein